METITYHYKKISKLKLSGKIVFLLIHSDIVFFFDSNVPHSLLYSYYGYIIWTQTMDSFRYFGKQVESFKDLEVTIIILLKTNIIALDCYLKKRFC